jgi:hypothetical protein
MHGPSVLRRDDIDSFSLDQNTGVFNTEACDNYILGGVEPINWAYITKSGVSQAPANPLFTGTFSSPNFAAVNPDPTKDLFMNPGDRVRIHMHDTAAGLRIEIDDLNTGESGSMTASVANGFGHILYTPNSDTCQMSPYAFHPEYSTANPRGNTWSAHTYNVAFSDEIGHFENCLKLNAEFNCVKPGKQDSGGLDPDDDNFCVRAQTRRSSTSTDASAPTGTGMGSRTRRIGRDQSERSAGSGSAPHAREVHQSAGERDDQL